MPKMKSKRALRKPCSPDGDRQDARYRASAHNAGIQASKRKRHLRKATWLSHASISSSALQLLFRCEDHRHVAASSFGSCSILPMSSTRARRDPRLLDRARCAPSAGPGTSSSTFTLLPSAKNSRRMPSLEIES